MKALLLIVKTFLIIVLLLLLIAGLSIPYALYKKPDSPVSGITARSALIYNAQIIGPDNRILPYTSISIEDGIITGLSQQPVEVLSKHKDFDLTIDVHKKYLMPGLIDMHTHVIDQSDLLLSLAHGVTHLRVMHGLELQLKLKKAIKTGQLIGPDLILASPALNQKSSFAHSDFQHFVETEQEAREAVRRYKDMGFDLIKLYDGLQPDIFKAIVSEAQKHNMPFAGHPPFKVNARDFLASQPQTLEHVEMLYQTYLDYSREPQALQQLIQDLKTHATYVSTTLVVYDELVQAAEQQQHYLTTKQLEYIPPIIKLINQEHIDSIMLHANVEKWRSKADDLGVITKALFDADIPMVLASDAGANYTLHGIGMIEEMQLLEHYGVSPQKIIDSATLIPAQALSVSDAGRIMPGKKASLLMLENDPRQDLSTFYNLQGLFKNNTYFNAQDISEMKSQAKLHMGYYELLGWLIIDRWTRR